jgi:large subunit ribosomal protein L13
MAEENKKNIMIIDASNATLGRLASFAAKQALQGKNVVIVNCSNAIITGNKKGIQKKYQEKRSRKGSSQKGPIFPRKASDILKRTIRGMLPDHRKGRGKQALKRVVCYDNVPSEYEKENMIKTKKKKFSNYILLNKV